MTLSQLRAARRRRFGVKVVHETIENVTDAMGNTRFVEVDGRKEPMTRKVSKVRYRISAEHVAAGHVPSMKQYARDAGLVKRRGQWVQS